MQLTKRTQQEKKNVPVHTTDPARSVRAMQEMMDQLFERRMLAPFRSGNSQALVDEMGDLMPRVDISETDAAIKVRAEVPGIDPKDVAIEVTDDTVSLSGVVERSAEEQQENYYRVERGSGRFAREFALPCKVDTATASAKTENGVITITLEKQPSEQKKRVMIEGTGT